MGFDETVLDAILIIKDAVASMTEDMSHAAAWLGGVVENVWKVLFTSGNEVEALASLGRPSEAPVERLEGAVAGRPECEAGVRLRRSWSG